MVKPRDPSGQDLGKSANAAGSDQVLQPENKPAKNIAGEVFGLEVTNKTLPEPQSDSDESEVRPGGQGKYVSPTPYTRKV